MALKSLPGTIDRLSTKIDHLSVAVNHAAASLAGLSGTFLRSANCNKDSLDVYLVLATFLIAFLTLVLAAVPVWLDQKSTGREKKAVRRQMAVIAGIIEARVSHLEQNPIYPSAILKEGLEGYLLRSLQTEVGRAFTSDELKTLYNAMTKAAGTIAEAAHQQMFVAQTPESARKPVEVEANQTIRERAGEATTAMKDALKVFTLRDRG